MTNGDHLDQMLTKVNTLKKLFDKTQQHSQNESKTLELKSKVPPIKNLPFRAKETSKILV